MRGIDRRPALGLAVLVAVVVLASACQWKFARYDAANTGYNPTETEVGVANAAGLHEEWASTPLGGNVFGVPIVSGSMVYVAGSTGTALSAFDRNGVEGCSGAPTTCSPLWTTTGASGQPYLANGTIFAAGAGGMRAFDPAGITNCAGSPKVCQPLWTASPSVDQPIVVGEVLFGLSSTNTVVAYDVNGVTNCSGTPRVCTPLRTYEPACSPTAFWCTRHALSASGDELVVVAEAEEGFGLRLGYITAYDLSGDRSCTGTPVLCTPIWHDSAAGASSPPALSQGVVYSVGRWGYPESGLVQSLTARRLEDLAVLWTNPLPSIPLGVAVGEGSIFVALRDRLLTFPIDTGGCTYDCPPSRTALLASWATTPPTVANGVVVVGTQAGIEVFAADGSAGCGGSPATCTPLVTLGAGVSFSGISIAYGNVWAAGWDGRLHSFGLG